MKTESPESETGCLKKSSIISQGNEHYEIKLFPNAKSAVVFLALFFCLFYVEAESENNYINNPGLEDGNDGYPLGWKPSAANKEVFIWDNKVSHTGNYSISVFNKQPQEDAKYHNLWSQLIPLKGKETYIFSVWIKTKDVTEKEGRAGIDICILNNKGEKLRDIGQSAGLRRIHGNSDWTLYKTEFTTPDDAASLAIYALMQKNTSGQIWFDDFSLTFLYDPKESKYREVFPFATKYDQEITDLIKDIIFSSREVYAMPGTPAIDGNLTDLCWLKAPSVKSFLVVGSDKFAKEETTVSLCHDQNNLYFAFNCQTADTSKIKAAFNQDEQNPMLWYDDCVDIFINSKEKGITAHLIVNSKGAKWKGLHRGLEPNIHWMPSWQAAASLEGDSWKAEISIPLKELTSVLGAADSWSINLCRENKTNSCENSSICFLPYSNRFLQPQYFAKISFVENRNALLNEEDSFTSKINKLHDLLDNRREVVIASNRAIEYMFKYAFDFGSVESPVKNGFTKMTPEALYSSTVGYGWVNNASMFAVNRGVEPTTGSPNELTCDFIESKDCNQFRMDLPDGEYIVYLISGDTNAPAPKFNVYSDDEELGEIAVGGRYNFLPFSFPVTATNNRLLLTFKGKFGWLINSLIVYPKKDFLQAQKESDKIEREIYLGSPEHIIKYAKHIYNETNTSPEETENKGYLIFKRNYLDIIYPNTIPKNEEITRDLSIFATPGEYEPITFSIFPIRELKNVKISVSDLINSEGEIIDKSNIDLREVKYYFHNVAMSTPPSYMLFPKILDKIKTVNIEKRRTTTIWLTIRVPGDAHPGDYDGKIKIETDNAVPTVLDLNLKIFPFKLIELKKPIFNMCYHLPVSCPARGIDGWNLLEQDLIDMKNHNMNSVNLFIISQNIWDAFGERGKSIHTAGLLKFLNLCKNTGLTEPATFNIGPYFPWDPNQSARKEILNPKEWQYVIDAVNEVGEISVAEKLPEVLWYIDEPASETKKQNVLAFFKFLKENCPQAKTFVTLAESFDSADVVCPDTLKLPELLLSHPNYIAEQKKRNVSVWTYNGASNPMIPVLDRLGIGFMMWLWGVDGQENFTYQLYYYHRNPYNPLDDISSPMYGHTYPGADGPIPTTTWEAIREGIDDLRYIKTLEEYIDLSKKSNNQNALIIAQNAEVYLKDFKSKISSFNWKDCVTTTNSSTPPSVPAIAFYDFHRRKIADFINELYLKLYK